MTTLRIPTFVHILARRETWLRVFTYALFIFSTFSIAGISAAVAALYLATLYHRLRQPVTETLPRWMVVAFLLFPVAAIASALANGIESPLQGAADVPNPLYNIGRWTGLYRIFLPLALLPALGLLNRRHLLLTLLVFASAMTLYATIQFRWGVDWFRPEGEKLITPYFSVEKVNQGVYHGKGNFSHHITFAGVMLMLAPMFASLAWEGAGRVRLAWGAGAFLATVGVLVSLSRGGGLGVGVGLLLLLLRFPRRIFVPLVALALLLGLAGVLFESGWLKARFASPDQPALVKRILSISTGNNRERLYLWESGVMGIRDRPWLGVGYKNVKFYAPAYRTDIAERRNFTFKIDLKTHMHNVFLQVGFELGLLGLAAFLLWWGAIFHWNRMWLFQADERFPFDRALLYGTSGGLAGIMAAGFFDNNFFDSEVQTIIMIFMGLSLHAGLQIRRGVKTGSSDR